MKKLSISTLFFLLPMLIFSQTDAEREKIKSFSNIKGNTILNAQLTAESIARNHRLNQYFNNNPLINKVLKDDGFYKKEIVDILPNGEILYAVTDNAGAAITARANTLYNGGTFGTNIQGQNMIAGVWDGGSIRSTHQEFMLNGASKISILDGAPVNNHATHVGGTIAARGLVPSLRGLAFNSTLKSYNWGDDTLEMFGEALQGLLTSNHSYGFGQLGSIWFYGAYDSRAKTIDEICMNNPFYLPVFAAGNDRNSTEAPGSTQIANKFGYDLIFGHGNAKNVMTVAAVEEVPMYFGPTSVVMSNFSSWGPSDDGRIKPDISMKGVGVNSPIGTSDSSTAVYQGTSMASPGVTGVVLLMQQYHNQLYSNYMKAATVKGLLLHTASEAGFSTGPDYSYGWGLINAEKAASLIKNKLSSTPNKSIIEELNLIQGGTILKNITASGSEPLMVSISWTDPASLNVNNGTVDPAIKYLVNDLDLKVISLTDGSVHYPWSLKGMAEAYLPAENIASNNTDNFERIDIAVPAGNYLLEITHKGILQNGNQNFSLIASAGNLATLSTTELQNTSNVISIYPNPTSRFINLTNIKDYRLLNVKILDMTGKIVKNAVPENGKINVEDLVEGQYLLKIYSSNYPTSTIKFIKKQSN